MTSMPTGHVPVRRLLLPVQRLFQDQLGELASVRLGLHIQVKVVVRGDIVSAQSVRAHVRVERALQGETGARSGALRDLHRDVRLREAGRVVVDVHHLDLDPKQLQRVLQEHLHVELAAGALPADMLPVDFFANEQDAVLQVHLQVRRARAGHHLEPTGGQLGKVQSQVLGDIPHQGAMVRLLRHRVAYLREHSIRDAHDNQKHNHRRETSALG
uniref:Uncharacterized protein n=1 Tax=Cyclopterus lumpus TaxID=8103 RepID=A0A8C2Z0L7_CYCLU